MAKKNIPRGMYNHILSKIDKLPVNIKILSDKRSKICDECEHKSKANTCLACGCFLPAKTKAPKEKCPKNKW